MAVKPIDIQVNIGKMNEVARSEHARLGALAEQQKAQEEESRQKSAQADKTLDEMEDAERADIRDKERERGSGGKKAGGRETGEQEEEGSSETLKDDRAGRIIDLKG